MGQARLRCPDADCAVLTWSEDVDGVAPRAALTERAREEVRRRVGRDAHSVAETARAFGVSWHTATAAVRDHGLRSKPEQWRDGIVTVAIDPYRGYARAVADALPEAGLVVDHFHVVRVRHEAPCNRGRVRDPPHRAVAAVR